MVRATSSLPVPFSPLISTQESVGATVAICCLSVSTGALEPLIEYIEKAGYPKKAVISIGATRYTAYGETTFLEEGDEVIVVVYDNDLYCKNPIMMMAQKGELDAEGVSALVQKVKRA